MKAYKFRLYPSKKQEQTLFQTFKSCRFVYNQLLEKMNKQTKINRGEIQHSILELKKSFLNSMVFIQKLYNMNVIDYS